MQKVITLVKDYKNKIIMKEVINTIAHSIETKGGFVNSINQLSENEAYDIIFEDEDIKGSLNEELKDFLVKNELDFFITDNTNRRKKLIICDMDSTIIEQECINEIADEFGIKEDIQKITDLTMEGNLDFEKSLEQRVILLKGLDVAKLKNIYDNKISFSPGAKSLVCTMRNNGAYCVLASGGFTFFTEKVSQELGFNEHHGNQLEFLDNKLTGKVLKPVLNTNAKKICLENAVQKLKISIQDTIAVGDGSNDLDMLLAANLGIAYYAKPIVKEKIHYQINYTSLKSVLFMQGYNEKEIRYS